MTKAETMARLGRVLVFCDVCRLHVRKYKLRTHEATQKHQVLAQRQEEIAAKSECVSDKDFAVMLWQVLAVVSPEVILDRMNPKPETPTATSLRSKAWRVRKAALNPYGVTVGQVWRRMAGMNRDVVEVVAISTTHASVSNGMRVTRVRLDRFTPEYQGYMLEKGVAS